MLINLLPLGEACLQPPQQHRYFSFTLNHTSTRLAVSRTRTCSDMSLLDRISDVAMKVVPARHPKPRRSMSGGIGSAAAMGVMHDDVSALFNPPGAAPIHVPTVSSRHSHSFIHSFEPSTGRSISLRNLPMLFFLSFAWHWTVHTS